jgi:hypothetical protein
VLGAFGWVLTQSSLSRPLSLALARADVLVTAVFAVGGWAFVRFMDNINKRFDAADQRLHAVDQRAKKRSNSADKRAEKRFNAADERLEGMERSLEELKALIRQALPAAR